MFSDFWASAVSLVWGLPLVFAVTGAGLYFTIASRLIPLRAVGHAIDILRGRYNEAGDPGEISHFQALTSALSATIGMGNIAGVAIAVAVGGPGAVFWMWVSGLVGMSTKFFTCTLACMYRKRDVHGVEQGGPMYFIEIGLGPAFKPLAVMFAACGMVGTMALFQSNQLATLLEANWGVQPLLTGSAAMLFVGAVIIGGIKRIGRATAALVPAMCVLYLACCMYVVLTNITAVPATLLSILQHAVGVEAVAGGAIGLTFKEILVTGIQRAAFSNEAGMGTAPLAHGAAKTREPVREGLVAMVGPFIDTHVVCTLTALVILMSGVTHEGGGIVMTAQAFEQAMPHVGNYLLACMVVLFAVSTMVSYSYYSIKCSRYLFGERIGGAYLYVYLGLIPLAAIWSQETMINVVDTAFALMAVPTLTGSLLLSGRVVAAFKDYFERMGI